MVADSLIEEARAESFTAANRTMDDYYEKRKTLIIPGGVLS
jgi:hypothetical protein